MDGRQTDATSVIKHVHIISGYDESSE